MSQYFQSSESAPSPPDVPTTFQTESGNAVPAANIIIFATDSTTNNNNDGITNTGAGNTVTHFLTNRFFGSQTSTLGSNADLVTFDLGASPAVYRFEFKVAGRDTGTGDGVGYQVFASARTDGVAATLIATPFIDADEDASLTTSSIDFIVSGNNVILRFNGTVTQTVQLSCVGYYVVV